MITLRDYLAGLICEEDTQWGIYANPHNLDDFHVSKQNLLNFNFNTNDKVYIGSLAELSCGCQESMEDALLFLLYNEEIEFRGVVFSEKNCNFESFKKAYFNEKLPSELQEIISELIDDLTQEWSEDLADLKIEEIENSLKSHQNIKI